MSDVFISYKRENLAAVNRLVEALRAEGVGVWWDQDIPPNAPWEAIIEHALAASKLVIVAWSPAAVVSDNVKAEARWARAQGRLLQVFVEACEPPLFFGERQGVDLKYWSGAPAEPPFRSLLQAVRVGLNAVPASVDNAAAPSAAYRPLPLPSKPSVAVMPFANLSGDPEQEYFADGMVAEITNALSRFKSILVIASSSALTFKGKNVGAQEAARELGVRYVLEGSVRKAGERVRIAAQLIDASEDVQLWAERFDGTLEDVFTLQDTVANAVAGQIEPTIQVAEIRRANARPTEDLSAYDLYLRALPLCQRYDKDTLDLGLDLLDRAIARDPEYALALATAAAFRATRRVLGWSDNPDEERRVALEYRARALRAAPDDPDVLPHAALAAVMGGMDRAVAEAAADRALALNPGAAFTWYASGLVHAYGGQGRAAVAEFETSLRLDPRSAWRPLILDGIAIALFSLRRFDEVVVVSREVCDLVPGLAPMYAPYIASALAHAGRLAEAREMAKGATTELLADWARWLAVLAPADRELVLSGFALAQGRN